MLKGKSNTASVAPRGIHVTTSVYGKAVKLVRGICQITPDLIWYNDWQTNSAPTNGRLFQVTGGSSKKKGGKKGDIKYYSAAVDFALGTAPIIGILTCWYNNQRLRVEPSSSSGFISGNSFSFTPSAGESIVTVTDTVPGSMPYVITVPDFVSDGQTTQNNTGVYDNTIGRWLASTDPLLPPGPNQYTVDGSGNYAFNAAQAGHSVKIHYRKLGSGATGVLAAIFAVTINEKIPTTTFNDFGAPGSVTMSGHWDRPLWNKAFPVPGRIDSGAKSGRDPYSWSWDGSSATVTFPDTSFDGYPVTVYYGVPVINKSDGTFYSSNITPLALLNMELEAECGEGSEYVNHPEQQDINAWAAGAGSVRFDLGTANSVPNLLLEAIGDGTCWPNGDSHVADAITDVVVSGPVLPALVPHGANCNDYDYGGPLSPSFPPGNGLLLGALNANGVPAALVALNNWCIANGISVVLNQDTQRTAKDLVDELALVGNSAPVYSGDTLNLIPYDEVSNVGYGVIYEAPTQPVFAFTDVDYWNDGNAPPVQLVRKRRTDCDNAASIEFPDRDLDYVQNVVTESDAMGISLWGPRKGGTLDASALGVGNPSGSKTIKTISNSTVAQAIASVQVQVNAAGENQYQFELKAENFWLEAMDVGTITDSRLGLSSLAVRVVDVKETSKRTYQVVVEKFVYGLHHPRLRNPAGASGTLVQGNIDPGFVNPPVIFQPTCAMSKSKAQVWFVVSGGDPNFGGCFPCVSIDGGVSYTTPGELGFCPPGTTGYLTGDFPQQSPEQDPDTTDSLAVDLTECGGSLTSQSQEVADASLDMCYVSASGYGITIQNNGVDIALLGAVQNNGTDITMQVVEIDANEVPIAVAEGDFEAVCPTVATQTAQYKYDLTTYIRRGVKDSTYSDHPIGSRFAVLDSALLAIELDSYWVGRTVLFKFPAVNKLGGQMNNLPDCTVYAFGPQSSPCM